ncbi:hypothetical protein Tco_0895414 [Tanacetum coccineum]|uniref:Reverse transcriptase Ty1/copia-type domain-containing protein n=1 Tax=Tanacetum coccineum TaxID=301880 RepID=A0ABQ5CG20_9ASTR
MQSLVFITSINPFSSVRFSTSRHQGEAEKEDGIFISQDKYVTEILKKFGFSDVKTANTPIETHKPLLKDVDGEDVDEHIFQVNPKISHLHAVKRIFRYLKDRKSTTGGYQFLGCRLISWQCKKQIVVANSTTEAEYIIYIDNESTKHIEIRHHFIRDSNEKKLIQMIKILTDKNVADLLTKAFDNGIGVNAGNSKLMLLGINLLLLGKVNAVMLNLLLSYYCWVTYYCWLKVNAVMHNLQLLANVNAVEGKTVTGKVKLQALVDGKKVIITKTSVRRDLQLEDVEGIECLPNADILSNLLEMGYEKPSKETTFYKAFFSPQWKFLIHTILQCLSAKSTAWNEFSRQFWPFSVKFLMYPRFVQVFLDKQVGDMSTHDEIFVHFTQRRLFGNIKRVGNGLSRAVTPLFPTMMVQAQEEMGKDCSSIGDFKFEVESQEGRKIDNIDKDAEDVVEKEVSTADPVTSAGKVVTTTSVEVSAATTTTTTAITEVDLTLAQALAESRSTKPKVVDKGKAKMIKPEKPLKKKEQIRLDEELAFKLQAEEEEQARLA